MSDRGKNGEREWIEAKLKQNYKYENFNPGVNDITHFNDIAHFIDFLEKSPSEKELFKDYFIFKCVDRKMTWERWVRPVEVYLDLPFYETGLSAYYELEENSQKPPYALSIDYKSCGIEIKKIAEFAKRIGAQTKLEPKKQPIPSNHPEIDALRKRCGLTMNTARIDEDYNIQEFVGLLRNPSLEKSQLIWNTMVELSKLESHEKYLRAVYRPNESRPCRYGKSILVHELKDSKWVPQRQNNGKHTFVKPADAVRKLLPADGFPFDTGAKWLEAIGFSVEPQPVEPQPVEPQPVEPQPVEPQSVEPQPDGEAAPLQPEEIENPDQGNRRNRRLQELYRKAPKKKSVIVERTVRTTQDKGPASRYLKGLYTDESGKLICQLCDETMPFKKKDGEYYFETVELLANLEREIYVNYLALCPTCAAKFNEYVVRSPQRDVLPKKLASLNGLELPLKFDSGEERIRFEEKHLGDIKAILKVEKEQHGRYPPTSPTPAHS